MPCLTVWRVCIRRTPTAPSCGCPNPQSTAPSPQDRSRTHSKQHPTQLSENPRHDLPPSAAVPDDSNRAPAGPSCKSPTHPQQLPFLQKPNKTQTARPHFPTSTKQTSAQIGTRKTQAAPFPHLPAMPKHLPTPCAKPGYRRNAARSQHASGSNPLMRQKHSLPKSCQAAWDGAAACSQQASQLKPIVARPCMARLRLPACAPYGTERLTPLPPLRLSIRGCNPQIVAPHCPAQHVCARLRPQRPTCKYPAPHSAGGSRTDSEQHRWRQHTRRRRGTHAVSGVT